MKLASLLRPTPLLVTLPLLALSTIACRQPQDTATSSVPTTTKVMAMAAHDMADMDLGPKDEYFDLRFIDAMILHHQGAIDMAKTALERSSRAEMQTFAQAIITTQQQEIQQMQQWRQAWYPQVDATPMVYHAEAGHMMPMPENMQVAMQMSVDLGAADAQFDYRFLDAMIPHHEGALVMAQQVLQKSDRPELLALAQTILTTQQAEIEQMQRWRQAW